MLHPTGGYLGYDWITGRIDDVLNVSGHRLGTAEIESALVAHEAVAEAAVVGFPHEIKGTGIYAFVSLSSEYDGLGDTTTLADPEIVERLIREHQLRTTPLTR